MNNLNLSLVEEKRNTILKTTSVISTCWFSGWGMSPQLSSERSILMLLLFCSPVKAPLHPSQVRYLIEGHSMFIAVAAWSTAASMVPWRIRVLNTKVLEELALALPWPSWAPWDFSGDFHDVISVQFTDFCAQPSLRREFHSFSMTVSITHHKKSL